jgi:hypothetical protein
MRRYLLVKFWRHLKEMTNDTAKLVLHSYRPNDLDATDPRFRATFDQAAHDLDLAGWFNQQRIFDTFIANRLPEIHPPADLLVVIAENAIPAMHFDEYAREQDGWRIKYESGNGLLVIFFSRVPMNQIIQFT